MKRDWDLIRRILLYIHDNDVIPEKIVDYPIETVNQHYHIMKQAGYIVQDTRLYSNPNLLTEKGYDLYEMINDPIYWTFIKQQLTTDHGHRVITKDLIEWVYRQEFVKNELE